MGTRRRQWQRVENFKLQTSEKIQGPSFKLQREIVFVFPATHGFIFWKMNHRTSNRRYVGYRHSESPAANNLGVLFGTCFWLIRSGANPNQFEPRAWYDRKIRIVGGILILIVLGGGLILKIIDMFKK